MSSARFRSRSRRKPAEFLQKPRGVIHPRVQKVGPEHFGIVSVDCAKLRSKWMLCDFYGKVLLPPAFVNHNRVELDAAVAQVRRSMEQHQLADLLVAVERTGRYHHAVKNAFAAAAFDTRVVHPYATKQFRQPADPSNKTDDTDLPAIHRAAVNGFALSETQADPSWRSLQLLIRHRRSLVQKSSALRCQIREHQDGLARWLRQQDIGFQQRSLQTILQWAHSAAAAAVAADTHRQIALAYEDDRHRKNQEILALEGTIAHHLARTPYILLLSFPGSNVVSAADFAGEMGPIANYANPKSITGLPS